MRTLQARWTAASATAPQRWRAKDKEQAMGRQDGVEEMQAAELPLTLNP
jgi:hypothetical protein